MFTKTELDMILSALAGRRRSSANREKAMKAIAGYRAERVMIIDDILNSADELHSISLSAEEFVAELTQPPAAEPGEDGTMPALQATAEPSDAVPPEDHQPAEQTEHAAGKSAYGTFPEGVRSTKQATMIEMLSRPEGATAEQIMEATGWQKHTVRGAIAGALKKKLGLTIATEKVRSTDGAGARGSYTVYRIAG